MSGPAPEGPLPGLLLPRGRGAAEAASHWPHCLWGPSCLGGASQRPQRSGPLSAPLSLLPLALLSLQLLRAVCRQVVGLYHLAQACPSPLALTRQPPPLCWSIVRPASCPPLHNPASSFPDHMTPSHIEPTSGLGQPRPVPTAAPSPPPGAPLHPTPSSKATFATKAHSPPPCCCWESHPCGSGAEGSCPRLAISSAHFAGCRLCGGGPALSLGRRETLRSNKRPEGAVAGLLWQAEQRWGRGQRQKAGCGVQSRSPELPGGWGQQGPAATQAFLSQAPGGSQGLAGVWSCLFPRAGRSLC